jgi:hypothetical protein
VRLEHVAERLRRIARHFGGRITCRIWRRLGQWLGRFNGRIARWIMHRLVGRITFGRRYWIMERLYRAAGVRRHGNFLSRSSRLATGAKQSSSREPARHWFISLLLIA